MRRWTYSLLQETIYNQPFPTRSALLLPMLPVVIVLVLLTALVATEPSSPGRDEE
jgi:hypothetical protein